MYCQRILAGLLALSCLFAPLGFAEANTHRSRIWAEHPANVDLLYDYVEMIANTEPILQYVDNPTTIPDRIAPSPNFYNDGELSHRAFLLHQNYCPAGWETENQTYYPLTYSRYGIQAT